MSSPLKFLEPVFHLLPEVKAPSTPPGFNQKVVWTVLALVIFFAMYNVAAVGVSSRLAGSSDFLQVVTASKMGSLLTTGIGPIVLASIFLQLFVGAKLLNVDLKDPEQRSQFYGTQKLLAILLCIFEAYVYVMIGHLPLQPLFPTMEGNVVGVAGDGLATVQTLAGSYISVPMSNAAAAVGTTYAPYTAILVLLQIALGSIVLLFLDEVVAKHGLGSGISLFIAAGVSLAIVGGAINLFTAQGGIIDILRGGGAEVIATALMAMLPLLFTVIVFLVVAYMEGVKVEVPLSFDRGRGFVTGFPIKLTYVSNIPVILALALIANFQFLAIAMSGAHWCITGTANLSPGADPLNYCQGGIDLVAVLGLAQGGGAAGQARFVDGLLYLVSPTYRPANGLDYGGYLSYMLTATTPVWNIPEPVHILVYTVFLMVVCVVFGQFWVETTGMGPKEVAEQLDSAGLQIPGFRRDPRVVTALLEKYIPPIVVIGSAFVGLLAAVADLTGALGTGTGILLTVAIVYKFYQDIERQQVFETSALMSGLFGKGR
ncbi:Protein translocase subunit SecY [uncultured archaeon]|nr:Protein translocase subunit SecY [uncultured archaeon]